MRALLLLNPYATTTTVAVRERLVDLLSAEVDLEVAATKSRGHAVHLAAGAVHDGVDAVFALGGDGTANEVLQGLAGSDVPLGLLPGGGANVLARGLGLPNDALAAARVQLDALTAGLDRRIGLGRVNERWFGMHLGIGYDAETVHAVEQRPGLKRVLRQLAFVVVALRTWASGRERTDPAVRVVGPDGTPGDPMVLLVVGNTDPYAYLGPLGLHLTPGAHADAALATAEIGPMPFHRFARAGLRSIRGGGHDRDPGVRLRTDLDRVVVVGTRPVHVQVDGDWFGEHQHVEVVHVPRALRVLVDPPPRVRSDG